MERLLLRRPSWWSVVIAAFLAALLTLGFVAFARARTGQPSTPPRTLGDAMLAVATAVGGISLQYNTVTGGPSSNHANHAPVLSVQWGNARNIGPGAVGAERNVDPPTTTDICVTRLEDKYSPKFMVESLTGIPRGAIIYFTKPSADGTPLDYMRIEMKNALISSFRFNSKGDNAITESICFNFTKVNVVFQPVRSVTQAVSWDYVAHTPLP